MKLTGAVKHECISSIQMLILNAFQQKKSQHTKGLNLFPEASVQLGLRSQLFLLISFESLIHFNTCRKLKLSQEVLF